MKGQYTEFQDQRNVGLNMKRKKKATGHKIYALLPCMMDPLKNILKQE